MRKVWRTVVGVVAVVVVAAAGFLGVATVTEYDPPAVEDVLVTGEAVDALAPGASVTLLTFNIGYAGLGEGQDFFLDGGEMVRPDSKAVIETNLAGVAGQAAAAAADIYLFQEVDTDAHRSYGVNEYALLSAGLGGAATFAYNFKSLYTPYPWPPIGHVESGLLTLSRYPVAEASRIALPVPFTWPVRLFNLKRALLVDRIGLTGSERDLVVVNLHLEAYEDGSGRAAQTAQLLDFIADEYAQGNYVIAGGDFNQTFPGVDYPAVSTAWQPGVLDASAIAALGEGWTIAHDAATPTCRLNDHPLTTEGPVQYFGIDGFITSPNVTVEHVTTLDGGFAYADHNPVQVTVTLAA
ncbi:MAG: hypothetical protein LBR33_01950 [Propionibacteriaceae bacterium]|jgi:endonuclease/exonuclease/phosphatase family metal-dependent hydrolase|nr:hypothetical protein [Propionibacteriaceae bacterium]